MSRQQSDKIEAREHKSAQLDKEAREFRDAHKEQQPAAEPPWRALEWGEIIQEGDEYRGKNAGWTAIHYSIGEPFNLSDLIDCRTRRPLPSAPPDSGQADIIIGTTIINPEAGQFEIGEPEPAPAQTAREWVDLNDNPETGDLPASKAIELADRADRAEAELRKHNTYVTDVCTTLRCERDRLREALEWLEDEAPVIAHDAWSCSVDMGGNHWTLQFRNNGKRERIRGRTLIETIDKARAALNQTKQ